MTTSDDIRRIMRMDQLAGLRIKAYFRKLNAGLTSLHTRHMRPGKVFAPDDVIQCAVRNKDVIFLNTVDDSCVGLQKVRGNWPYKFLQSIEADDIGNMPQLADRVSGRPLQDLHYFKFRSQPDHTYFLTAAHLVRSQPMLMSLAHMKADFNAPDSEGRLPLYFIARYAKNRWMIPLLVKTLGVDPNNSGEIPDARLELLVDQDPNYHEPDAEATLTPDAARRIKGIDSLDRRVTENLDVPYKPEYDPPIIQAITHLNLNAVRGFAMLGGSMDMNIRFAPNRMTPLIYAVLKADDAVFKYREWSDKVQAEFDSGKVIHYEISRADTARYLWLVRFLASQARVDHTIMDTTGAKACDYACSDAVKRALAEGIAARKATHQLRTAYPSLRFTRS